MAALVVPAVQVPREAAPPVLVRLRVLADLALLQVVVDRARLPLLA